MKFVETLVGKMRDEILMFNCYNDNSFWYYSTRSLPRMWSEDCKYSSIDITWHLVKNAAFQVIPDLLNHNLHVSKSLE